MSKRGLFNTLVQSHFLMVFGLRRTLTFFMKMQQSMLLGWRHCIVALKVGDKMILYYSFLLCNKKKKNSEPLVNTEILTDSHDKQPIKKCLHQFITDEKKKYSHTANTIPTRFTFDM